MNILFIGDIVGKPGRRAVAHFLPELLADKPIDFVIANAENSAGGLGTTPDVLDELMKLGVHGFTMGNHTWRKNVLIHALDRYPLVRPANYPPGVPGRGSMVLTLPDGRKLGVVNLIGRIYMEPNECPFLRGEREVSALQSETPVVLVDFHAEATSEKIALGWHLDGCCSAVLGTHTHVQTADTWIMPGGTAFQCDVGMCGPRDSVIGTIRDKVINRFITGMPEKFEVAGGPAVFCAVLLKVNDASGQTTSIERFMLHE